MNYDNTSATNLIQKNQALESAAVYINLQQKVLDKLRNDFVDLLPAAQLDALTSSCLDEFLNGPRAYRFTMERIRLEADDPRNPDDMAGYHTVQVERPVPMKDGQPYIVGNDTNTLPGMLTYMLKQLAHAQCIKHLGLSFSKDGTTIDYNASINTGTPGGQIDFPNHLNTAVKEWLDANTTALVSSMFGQLIHTAVNTAFHNMRSAPRGY